MTAEPDHSAPEWLVWESNREEWQRPGGLRDGKGTKLQLSAGRIRNQTGWGRRADRKVYAKGIRWRAGCGGDSGTGGRRWGQKFAAFICGCFDVSARLLGRWLNPVSLGFFTSSLRNFWETGVSYVDAWR